MRSFPVGNFAIIAHVAITLNLPTGDPTTNPIDILTRIIGTRDPA